MASVVPPTAPSKQPPREYRQPTVEDELEPQEAGEMSLREAETLLPPLDDGGLSGQDEDEIGPDTTIKPPTREGPDRNSTSPRTKKPRIPKRSSEMSSNNLDDEGRQDRAQGWPRNTSDMPYENPETYGMDGNEWGFLQYRNNREDGRWSSRYPSDSGEDRQAQIGSRPPLARTPEPTRYVVEYGRTVPVARRKSPVRSQPTRYIIVDGRTVPVFTRSRSEEIRDSQYQALDVFQFPLTTSNLRWHDYQVEGDIRIRDPREYYLHTSTLAVDINLQGSRSHSSSRSTLSSDELAYRRRHEQPSFYADEHGFVAHAEKPTREVRQRDKGPIYEEHLDKTAPEHDEHYYRETENQNWRPNEQYHGSRPIDEPDREGKKPIALTTRPKMTARPASRRYQDRSPGPDSTYRPDPEPIIRTVRPKLGNQARNQTGGAYFDNVSYGTRY